MIRGLAVKSFLAVLAAALTLAVVALAAATAGSEGSYPQPSGSVAPASVAPTSGSADDVPGIDATAVPTSAPATDAPRGEPSEGADTGELPTERTSAVNPGGQCVDLPDSSNIIEDPNKHPKWTIQPCQPAGDPASQTPGAEQADEGSGQPDVAEPTDGPEAPDGADPPSNSGGPPQGRTPALNPDGVCVEMPNNSDVVRHPEKHPTWTVADCSTSRTGQ